MFQLVSMVADFLDDLPADWCIAGGWALDLFVGKVTRTHLDVDTCAFTTNKLPCVEFFLDKGWRVEAKLGTGFIPVLRTRDFSQEMPYFFAIAPGTDFSPAYVNKYGDRRLRYLRDEQTAVDYIEIYFTRAENGLVFYEENGTVGRAIEKAILNRFAIPYLAPELVFLHKADWPKDKDLEDLGRLWPMLGDEQRAWLVDALHITRKTHAWFDQPFLRSAQQAGRPN